MAPGCREEGGLHIGTKVDASLALTLKPHNSVFLCVSDATSATVPLTEARGVPVSESLCAGSLETTWVFSSLPSISVKRMESPLISQPDGM